MTERTKVPAPDQKSRIRKVPDTPARRYAGSNPSPVITLLRLQRTAGNQAVVGLARGDVLQAKLGLPCAAEEIPETVPSEGEHTQSHQEDSPIIQRMVYTVDHVNDTEEELQSTRNNALNLARSLGEEPVTATLDDPRPLERLTNDETLYVVAHGSTNTVGGMIPNAFLGHLTEKGFKTSQQGLIDLVSCQAGNEFLEGFQAQLLETDFKNAVKGYSGLVHVEESGKKTVIPPYLVEAFIFAKKKAKELFDREKGELDQAENRIELPIFSFESGELVSGDPQGHEKLDIISTRKEKLVQDYKYIVTELNSWFEPAEHHERFGTREAWLKYGTPTTIEEWIELSKNR